TRTRGRTAPTGSIPARADWLYAAVWTICWTDVRWGAGVAQATLWVHRDANGNWMDPQGARARAELGGRRHDRRRRPLRAHFRLRARDLPVMAVRRRTEERRIAPAARAGGEDRRPRGGASCAGGGRGICAAPPGGRSRPHPRPPARHRW